MLGVTTLRVASATSCAVPLRMHCPGMGGKGLKGAVLLLLDSLLLVKCRGERTVSCEGVPGTLHAWDVLCVCARAESSVLAAAG